ncbi:MAG: 2-dehydropantoate 2-reductase [Chloroflexota bacterium]|nr:2-dehydropantoate 2-reductase [Chloroflexota bacterium]
MLQIAVVPAGAIGTYFGGRLIQAGAAVRFLARGAQLDALRTGLAVQSVAGDFALEASAYTVSDDPATVLRGADLVLFAPKAFDTAALAAALAPHLDPATVLISLQNGIENEAVLADILGPQRVAAGAAYIEAELDAPGHVTHRRLGRVLVAAQTVGGTPVPHLDILHALSTTAGITFERATDGPTLKWSKLVTISALSGWTAAARRKLDAILADPELHTAFAATLLETATVAAADGAQLDPAQTVAGVLALCAKLGDMGSSLLYDLEHGRRLEVDALNGAVVRKGRALGIPTPYNQALLALLGAARPTE